jgi:hypothetical protein
MIINSIFNKQQDILIYHINGRPRENKLNRCLTCGKIWRPKLGERGRPKTKFCSSVCSKNFFNNRFNHVDNIFISEKELTEEEKLALPLVECKNCGNTFYKSHFNRIYCSYNCALEAKNRTSTRNNIKNKYQCRGQYLGSVPPTKLHGYNNYKSLEAKFGMNDDYHKDFVYLEDEYGEPVFDCFEDADADAEKEYDSLDNSDDFNYDEWYGDWVNDEEDD